MTRKAVSLYMATTCAMVVAVPGRLGNGIVIAVELCFLMCAGTLFRSLLKMLRLRQLKVASMCTFIVACTVFFREVLSLMMPETALQLSFALYLPAISTFSSVFLFDERNLSLSEELKNNMVPASVFSAYIVLLSLARDVLGYGTLTLPFPGGMIELVLFDSGRITWLSFLATIPGALVVSALIMALYLTLEKRIGIIEKAGLEND